jgi:hypothetical protein
LRGLVPDEPEDGTVSRFGCTENYCYHNVGLCDSCGDIPGRNHNECDECDYIFTDRRYDQFWSHVLPDHVPLYPSA